MAQVKKFNTGGGLYLDGVKLTDEQINAAMDTLSAEDKYTWSKSIDKVRAGQRVDLNELGNSVTGGDFSHVLTDKQLEKNTSGNLNRRQRNRHARRGTAIDSTNRGIANGIAALKSQLNVPKEEETISTKTLGRGSGWFLFGEDGIYNEGPQNLTNEQLIRDAFAWLGGDENYRKGWSVSGYDNNETLNGLSNWYSGQNAQELIDRIKNKELTEDDREVLAALGFVEGDIDTTPKVKTTSDEGWTGDINAAARAGVFFTKNEDGSWNINSTNTNNPYLGSTWYNGGLDFLAGTEWADGFIGNNGRLYTRQQALAADPGIYSQITGWMGARDANGWRDWYDRANASGVRFAGDRISTGGAADNYGIFNTQFNPYTSYNEHWSDYFSGIGDGNELYDIADMSTAYSNLDGRQVLAYVDPSNSKDALGIRGVKYVVRDTDGKYTTYNDEASMLAGTGLMGYNDPYGISPSEFVSNIWENIDGKRYHLAYELNTQGDQQNVVLRGADGKLYLARKNGDQHLNPQEIKDPELLERILQNPQSFRTTDVEALTESKEIKTKKEDRRTSWAQLNTGYVSPLRKEGGLIPKIKELPAKFQYGGNLSKTKTVKNEKSSEGLRTDITSTHKINGEDGGLTKAEKMQIGAALGDLLGVGISFTNIPGSSFVSAGTGLLSTGTRFAADVKKDGFQAKDAWTALASGALDLASIVPILGTGAKTAKAVKTIKAAATPIMKALSLAGAANGVSALTKIMSGEKATSEDITAIISGLSSGIIAGKQFKDTLGKAKLAKDIEGKAIVGQNITTKPTATIGGKKMEVEIDAIKGKSKTEVEDLLKRKVKAELGDSFKEGEHDVDLLSKFGIGTNTTRSFKLKNLFKKGEKTFTSSETASFTPENAPTAHSTLRYLISPRLRNQQLGYDWGYFGQKSGNLGLVDDIQLSDAIKAVRAGKATLAQQELVKLSAVNPQAFNFDLSNRVNDFNKGWGWSVVGRQPVPYKNRVRLAEAIGPDGKPIVFRSLEPPTQGPIKDLTPVDTRELIGIGFDGKPIYADPIPEYIPGSRAALVKQWSDLHRFGVEGYKKGGKIIKGQSGLNPNWYYAQYSQTTPRTLVELPVEPTIGPNPISKLNTISPSAKKTSTAIKPTTSPSSPSLPKLNYDIEFEDINTPEYNPEFKTLSQDLSNIPGTIDHYATKINNETMNSIIGSLKTPTPAVKTSGQGNPAGEKPQRNLSWEMLPALGSIASNYAIATNAGKKQLSLAKDTYNSTLRNLEQNTPEFYNRYSEAGVDQTFNDAATAIQSQTNKARYADAGLNEAIRMEGAKQVSNLMLQKGQQKSQMFQNWIDRDNELRRNYALQRTAVENANRQRIAQADAYLNQQKGAAIAQQSAIDQGALGDLKQVLNVPEQSRLQQQQTDVQRRYQDWLRDKQSEYNNGIDNKSIASGTTFDNWLADNKTYMSKFRDYQDQLAGIMAKANYLKFKSGGTIKHRPEKEQIRINQQKIVADAIKQLSKQAFEFLKMALS